MAEDSHGSPTGKVQTGFYSKPPFAHTSSPHFTPPLGQQKIVSVQYLTKGLISRVTHQDNLWMIRKLDLTLSEKGTYIKKIQVRGI